jgi:hypothetical protein
MVLSAKAGIPLFGPQHTASVNKPFCRLLIADFNEYFRGFQVTEQ